MAKINSNQITFVDITDSRKLDIYISSNLPTTQIHNSNTGTYSPDWSLTNLQLTADVYLDSKKITPEKIQWYTKINTTETLVSSNLTLTVSTNVLSNNPIITYICRIEYQTIQAFKEITFMRADTGLDGSNGVDGTGVTILGSYNTLAELQVAHPVGNAGDAYIVDGNLYVWAIDDAQWKNVGNIQGPAGKDGRDAKSIVLSGDSQVFKVSKTNIITPSTIEVTAQAFNTTITNWTYSTNGGQTFLSTVPTGVSRNGNIVTITGSTIISNSIVIKASDGEVEDVFTVYKAIDGVDGNKGDDGAPAPIAFLTNENVTFSANAQGQISGTTITSNVVAYSGTTKVPPTIGTITGAPTGMTITPSITNNEVMLTITITNNSTLGSVSSNMGVISVPITYPVSTVLYLTWSKVNTGTSGTSASIVDITPSAHYFKSTTGKDGTFTPEYIYVYPRFQTVTFSKWEYSVNGGTTWVAASGANGLTIGTYNSIANTLRIARTSTLYTDTVTSISFRCVSSNAAVYDTVSIAKIYDVVDLQIGGRNLLLDSGIPVTNSTYPTKTYNLSIEPVVGEEYTLTLKGTLGEGKTAFGAYNSGGSVSLGRFTKVGTSDIYTLTFKWANGALSKPTSVYIYPLPNTVVVPSTIEWIKLEKGNKSTDWTPAPEDINAQIEVIDTKVIDGFAEVKTTTDSIIAKANSTEQTVATINGNLSSLTTRVSNAEQKITPTAIVSTVRQSTDYVNDLGKKVGNTEIISKINQTAESITISASKIGLLGATNIPDLTADKIKGGTLTLGGSSSATQNGQLLVKNASNVDVLKVNKDGIVVKSGHLAVAREFENSRYNWEDDSWTTTTNTSQLDLSDGYLRMGYYTPSGYSPNMVLSNTGLTFQGVAQGVGSWGSYIGHDSDGLDFVIHDSVRGIISFRGQGNAEMANLNNNNFDIKVPTIFSGGISYITIPSSANLNNYKTPGFYKCPLNATATTLTNCPTTYAFSLVVEEHAGVKQTLTVYLTSNQPIIYVRNLYDGVWGQWSRLCYAAENITLWSGVAGVNTTLTLRENFRDFRYLTCIIGTATEPFGIVLGSFLDAEVAELHFSASFTATSGRAGNNTYGAKFTVSSGTSIRLVGCGTIELANLSVRKIVGWR